MLDLYVNIKNRRKELHMTQTELAHKVGYNGKSSIASVESGKVNLPQSKILQFAKALDVTPQELMGWTSDDPGINEIADVIISHESELTLHEKTLIDVYRKSDELTQKMIDKLLNI